MEDSQVSKGQSSACQQLSKPASVEALNASSVSAPPPRTAQNPSNPAIASCLQDHESSRIPQTIASHSRLPRTQEHQVFSYQGSPPSDIEISRRSDSTHNNLPPGLKRATSPRPSQSVSEGKRQMHRALSIMIPDPDGTLKPTTLPHLRRRPGQVLVLECPFIFIKCYKHFNVSNEQEWIQRSLEHFCINGRQPRRVDPPKNNSCCFCPEVFRASDGVTSWLERMDHVKVHHHYLGHRMAAARHDFGLIEYLWQNGLLPLADYRELKPLLAAASRNAQNVSSPPSSSRPTGEITPVNEIPHDDRPRQTGKAPVEIFGKDGLTTEVLSGTIYGNKSGG